MRRKHKRAPWRIDGTRSQGGSEEHEQLPGGLSRLGYETQRQIRAAGEGERIVQETRGWDEERSATVSQRTKEYASDYRYFPEPDLPPLVIDPQWVQEIGESLPELPHARKSRFVEQYGLPEYDANLLTSSKATADFFEAVLEVKPLTGEPQQQVAKSVSNWMLGEVSRLLNLTGSEITDVQIQPRHLVDLVELIDAGTLSTSMAKTVLEEMFNTGRPPREIAEEGGLAQISDTDSIRPAVEEAIANNPQPVADYLKGKETAMRFLVGQVMKITRGKANPQLVPELLKEKLESMR